jgi:hypothetical protein
LELIGVGELGQALRIEEDESAGTGFHRDHELREPHDSRTLILLYVFSPHHANRTYRKNAGALTRTESLWSTPYHSWCRAIAMPAQVCNTMPDAGPRVTVERLAPSSSVYVPPREKVWEAPGSGLTTATPAV